MSEHAVALMTLLTVAFIWIGAFWFYTDYSVDLFRQRMFRLRDAFFDEAADGKISFSHPAYGVVRLTMNGLIRYGHRINLAFLLGTLLRPETNVDVKFKKRLEEHFGSLTKEQKELVSRYVVDMNNLALRRIFLGSPVLLVLFVVPLTVYAVSSAVLAWLASLLREPLEELDSIALIEGEPA